MKPCAHCGSDRAEARKREGGKAVARVWYRCMDCGACGPEAPVLWNGEQIDRHMTLSRAAFLWDQRDGHPIIPHDPSDRDAPAV